MNQQVKIHASMADFAANAFTAAEFLEMMALGAFEDMRAELVGGVIEKMAPAHGEHGRQNASIVIRLAEALGRDAPLATDLAVKIDVKTVRGIDIALARSKFPKGVAKGTDLLLAIEVSETTLARDLGGKAADYARAGVPAYWVVDLGGRVVHVMTGPGKAGYANRDIIRFGEELAVPGSEKSIIIEV
jgi:Uma2 family endonuclease